MIKNLVFTLMVCLVSFSLSTAQGYDEYETSNEGDLSFEAKKLFHEGELFPLNSYIEEETGSDIILSSFDMLTAFVPDIYDELEYLNSVGYTCENVRICLDDFEKLSDEEQDLYISILETLEEKYALTESEFEEINAYLEQAMPLATYSLSGDLELFSKYINLAYDMKYSVLEIFRDFTGYCDPIEVIGDADVYDLIASFPNGSIGDLIYPSPLDFEISRKHGLTANASIDRLNDVGFCLASIPRTKTEEVVETQFYQVTNINCNTVKIDFAPSFVQDGKDVNFYIYDVSGNKVLQQRDHLTDSNLISTLSYEVESNGITILLVEANDRIIGTQKIFCN